MTKFIKLTEANEGRRTLLLNPDHIAFIQTSTKPMGHVYIKMIIKTDGTEKTNGQYFFVEEKIEDIERMLND